MSDPVPFGSPEAALQFYLAVAATLFCIGLFGVLTRRNAVAVLMGIELMLNAANINLVAFARYVTPGQVDGLSFAVFVITVAAAEAAVGLAIVLALYRNFKEINIDDIHYLRW